MNYCKNCKTAIPKNAIVCPNCGVAVNANTIPHTEKIPRHLRGYHVAVNVIMLVSAAISALIGYIYWSGMVYQIVESKNAATWVTEGLGSIKGKAAEALAEFQYTDGFGEPLYRLVDNWHGYDVVYGLLLFAVAILLLLARGKLSRYEKSGKVLAFSAMGLGVVSTIVYMILINTVSFKGEILEPFAGLLKGFDFFNIPLLIVWIVLFVAGAITYMIFFKKKAHVIVY